MNAFEKLVEKVLELFPKAKVTVDPPERPTGSHWLDMSLGGQKVTIDWVPSRGFGIYAKDAGYGENPEKVTKKINEVLKHITRSFQK